MKTFLNLFLCISIAFSDDVPQRNGNKVVGVKAETKAHIEFLKYLSLSNQYDFWSEPRLHGTTGIMTNSNQLEALISQIQGQGMQYSIQIEDVDALIEQQSMENAKARSLNPRMDWESYHSFLEIEEWLLTLNDLQNVEVSSIGNSTEGRVIYQVVISTGLDAGNNTKPIIFIDGNIHSREWISGKVSTYIINELTSKPGDYQSILDKFDFYIVPILNPDGFTFSYEHYRLWRKTRSPQLSSSCYGVDPNRNFGFFFGGESTSSDPCADIYKGQTAFSEPETLALRNVIQGLRAENPDRIFAYFTIHSYGQLWLLSWGYTQGVYPDDYSELLEWGRLSTQAIFNTHGRNYTYGQGADMLYGVGGASDDWAKNEGIKYVATIEVRDTSDGSYGFILPASQILQTAEEVWNGIQVINTMPYGNSANGHGVMKILSLLFCTQFIAIMAFIR